MIRKDIQTRLLANGTALSIPVFHFLGTKKNTPSVYIQSGVHGSEVQGYLVTLQLIEHFSKHPPKGDIIIVPIANPYGLNCKIGEYTFGRFDPVTGDNWNRNYIDLSVNVDIFFEKYQDQLFDKLISLFKENLQENIAQKLHTENSYHKKLALQLQSLSVSADIVLDLHCDTISVPYLYCPSYAMHSAAYFGIPFVIEIPHTFAGALDDATFPPWIRLVEKYNHHHGTKILPPIEAFTIELGSQEIIDPKNATKQTQGILNYLSVKGVTSHKDGSILDENQVYTCKLENFIKIYAPYGGLILGHATLGNPLRTKDTLISLNTPHVWQNHEGLGATLIEDTTQLICSDYDAIPIAHSVSAVAHEGMELMRIMTHYQKF